MSDVRDALIHILQAENARLKKKNAMLARTSDYQYWTEEGVLHLKINTQYTRQAVKICTDGPYTVKIQLRMGNKWILWARGRIGDFLEKYAAPRLNEPINYDDVLMMHVTVRGSAGDVFSVRIGPK